MKTATKVLIILGMALGSPLIFPIIVGAIALKDLKNATTKKDVKVIGILTIFLCNPIAGIMMLCLKETDFLSPESDGKTDRKKYKKVPSKMICPNCRSGKMHIDKKAGVWNCENCGYILSVEEYKNDLVFWWCDECGRYLNKQEGFDRNATKHVCSNCGCENDTTSDHIKGSCSCCGELLPDPDATLCVDCRQAKRKKFKQWSVTVGALLASIAAAVGIGVLAASNSGGEEDTADKLFTDDGNNEDDTVFGLGRGIYPTCKTCGTKMTGFDGWAWYTCPECEDRVRIIDGVETMPKEISRKGKEHYSDFELADFCRGGELTED